MAYSKTSKINLYKFVQVQEPSSSEVNQGMDSPQATKALTKTMNINTKAINNLGSTVNSLGNVLISIKTIQLARLNEQVDQKKKFKPEYTKPKTKQFKFLTKLSEGKVPSFLEGIMKLLGAALKWFILLPTLKWLADERNQEKVVNIVSGLAKMIKFIFNLTEWGVTNTIDGLYDLLREDATWWERLKGFAKAFVGLGALFLGFRWLNPLRIGRTIGDFKNVLLFFNNNLKRSLKMLMARKAAKGLGMGLGGGKTKSLIKIGTVISSGIAINQMRQGGDDVGSDSTAQEDTKEEEKSGGLGGFLTGIRKNLPKWLGGLAAGGLVALPQAAEGGWIRGPQSGYPVTLGGGKTDFIGHGTEWVGRSAGGKAFVVPFDTPATRTNPNLTSKRWDEANRMGFSLPGMDIGGPYDWTAHANTLGNSMFSGFKGFDMGGLLNANSNEEKWKIVMKMAKDSGAKFPNLVAAQYALESGWGNSTSGANNFFGIKAASGESSTSLPTYEYRNGKKVRTSARFKNFRSPKDAINHLVTQWYKDYRGYSGVNNASDRNAAARMLKSEGYATDPAYVSKLIDIMNQYGIDPTTDSKRSGNWFQSVFGGLGNIIFGGPAHGATRHGGENPETTSGGNEQGLVRPAGHPETGKGFQPGNELDALRRPVVLSKPAAESFARMMQASKGVLKGSDVQSSGRSAAKNKEVGGHPNSHHLFGEALDIHGKSGQWMRQHGSKYGWKFHKGYKGHRGHFSYVGPGAGTTPKLGNPSAGGGGFTMSGMGFGAPSSSSSIESNFSNRGGGGKRRGGSLVQAAQEKRQQRALEKQTKAREYARQEIASRTQEMLKQVMGQVNVSNSENRQAISAATQLISQVMGAANTRTTRYIPGGGGGSSGRGTESGISGILRTTASVLNSFNNPLRGLFR